MMFWIRYLFLKIFRPHGRRTYEYQLFIYLNKARKSYGFPKLFFQNDLRTVARKHSQDMARHDYFAHEGRSGTTPKDRFEQLDITEVVSGENLAKIRGYKDPVLRAHDGLMNSPGHKANILSEHYNCVGIGLAVAKDKTYYFTQNFSHRNFIVRGARKRVWFFKKFKLKVIRLEKGHEGVMVVVKDNYDCEVQKKAWRFNRSSSLVIEISVPYAARFEVFIYNLSTRKLVNKFRVQKWC
jgi:hypothetical protein